jgi:hypothetical protein
MRFSVVYQPTSLFSLKDSNATNSGAKSLFIPSPYAIKMAIINQAIVTDGLDQFQEKESIKGKKITIVQSESFQQISKLLISYYLQKQSDFCVNNCFVKILRPAREGDGFTETVSFREYLYLSHPIEIIFNVSGDEQAMYLKKYLHKINYFGKRGCFFQFIEYKNDDQVNEANVEVFDAKKMQAGILQRYDDFPEKVTFDQVNNYTETNITRKELILVVPLKNKSSSKSYTLYQVFNNTLFGARYCQM